MHLQGIDWDWDSSLCKKIYEVLLLIGGGLIDLLGCGDHSDLGGVPLDDLHVVPDVFGSPAE
jgi:hypothetical protein